MKLNTESIRELFREHGIRCTRQRELVYAALASTPSHPTAEELLQLVHLHDSALSLATVYNTLEVLKNHGLCRKLVSSIANGPLRYDANVHDHAHGVFPNGEIVDFPAQLSERIVGSLSPDLREEIEALTGTKLLRIAVELVLSTPTRGCSESMIEASDVRA